MGWLAKTPDQASSEDETMAYPSSTQALGFHFASSCTRRLAMLSYLHVKQLMYVELLGNL